MTALAVLVVEDPAVQGRGGGVARRQHRPAAGVDDGVGGHGSPLLGLFASATSRRTTSGRPGWRRRQVAILASLAAATGRTTRSSCALLDVALSDVTTSRVGDFFPAAPRWADRPRAAAPGPACAAPPAPPRAGRRERAPARA